MNFFRQALNAVWMRVQDIGNCDPKRLNMWLIGIVIVLFAIFMIGFGHGSVAGSSIFEWNRIVPDRTESYSGGILGRSRRIRSDEWCTSFPYIMAQCKSPEFFPRVNTRVNRGTDMFIQTPCAPVWDWTAFGQFHNWGYFLFGADRGLAWAWWARYLLLPLFAFLFFMRWCDGDRLIAAVGSLSVALGAPTQWWDTTIPYHLTYFFAVLVFLDTVFTAKGRSGILLAGCGLFVALASYCFVNYPPFSLLLLPGLVTLSFYLWRTSKISDSRKFRYFVLLAVVVAVAIELWYFASIHGETLEIVRNSSYPGARFLRGGSFRLLCDRAISDWLSFFATSSGSPPKTNPCRQAEYIGLWLPVVFCIAYGFVRHRRGCPFAVMLTAYASILLLWVAFVWPDPLARWTGLSHIPMARASVIAGFLVLVVALRQISVQRIGSASVGRVAATTVIVLYLVFRVVSLFEHPDFIDWILSSKTKPCSMLLACFVSLSVIWGLLNANRRLFALSLMVFSLVTGLRVHPLSEGISPVYDKVLSEKIVQIDRANPGMWISNDWVLGALPMMLGVESWSGTQQYCDYAFWSKLDDKCEHKSAWNRYAHLVMTDLEDRSAASVKGQVDVIRYSLGEDKVRRLGIRYVLWRGRPQNYPWLRKLFQIRDVIIYEVCNSPVAAGGKQENAGRQE